MGKNEFVFYRQYDFQKYLKCIKWTRIQTRDASKIFTLENAIKANDNIAVEFYKIFNGYVIDSQNWFQRFQVKWLIVEK